MTQKRVVTIGLDGGTLDLIEPLASQGELPNLARLLSEGAHGRLRTTIQPTTAPAWVTFMTGTNQGKHGLYDFVRRKEGDYALEVTNATHINAPSFFTIASQAGLRVIAINLPYTSPPHPVNGIMIGGPFAPALTKDLVYPGSYFETLRRIAPDYFILPDFEARAADPLEAYAQRILQEVELRERVCLHMLEHEPWDLFSMVFMATDAVQHAFWHCQSAPEGSPAARHKEVIRQVYRRIDEAIGKMLAQIALDDRETTVFIISDHGFGPLKCIVNLNGWLAQAGYLGFRRADQNRLARLRASGLKSIARSYRRYVPPTTRLALRTLLGTQRFDRAKGDLQSALLTSTIDWSTTRAYVLGAGGNVFINLKGREPNGIVEPGQAYEDMRAELIDVLGKLIDPETQRPIVARVWRREELYNGPLLERAPDLIIEWVDLAYWGIGSYEGQEMPIFDAAAHFELTDLPISGSHRMDGTLIACGPNVRAGVEVSGARLIDMAPTILSALGIPVPEQMDGKVLQDLFGEELPEGGAEQPPAWVAPAGPAEYDYTPEEEAEITQHLRDLGYL